jgi:kynurenine formamidase
MENGSAFIIVLRPREHADREQDLDGEPSLKRREPAMPRRSTHRRDTPCDQGAAFAELPSKRSEDGEAGAQAHRACLCASAPEMRGCHAIEMSLDEAGRSTMMKTSRFIFVPFALGLFGTASIALAQAPVELKFSRVVDLTLPIETNMAGIPGFKIYADNPSQVAIIAAMTEGQKEMLRSEGMTLSNNVEINGRSMISVLSIMTHNGTHIDAPRHMMEKGFPVDQLPLAQVAKEGVLISLPNKGPNSSISVKDILDTGVALGPDRIPVIHTGWTDKMWGKPEFWSQMPYLEPGVGELMASKGVPALGMDVFPEKPLWRGIKVEPGEVWQGNHLALMRKGIPLIQFMTNLSQIGPNKFVLIALPLKMKGADGSPARVIALVE